LGLSKHYIVNITSKRYIVNFLNYVHRNEEVENPTIADDDAGQLLQINVGNQDDITKSQFW
jgi:hypothetical protein